ncbi:HdeD family acid-resistance protein [Falsiroseomonas sp. HW251]|uniref:HdeD family acid-resistance protein n=1 Tax=Falsiroseomonas sp. HW251 TaxID=3390998 RepID=UPI003D3196D8
MATSTGGRPEQSWSAPAADQVPTGKLPSTSDPIEALSAGLAENWWAIALRGVLGIAFGILAFAAPVAVMLSLALLFAAYCLIDGVLAIVAAVRAARTRERWWLLLLEGVLNLLMAAIAFVFPAGAVLAFVLVTAAWAILSGATMLGAAFRLAVGAGRWWLVLGGIVSMVFGVLLVLAPLAGAIVLTWWLGAYAIVFGGVMLILAFRLRRRRHDTPAVPAGATG